MKHTVSVTLVLILIFVISQLVGLALVNKDAEVVDIFDAQTNTTVTVVEHQDTVAGARPETEGLGTILFITISVAIGTCLILLLVKLRKPNIWKYWFLFAIIISSWIALGVVINKFIALAIAIVLAVLKVFKRNFITHNLVEILMYSGIAILLVPLFHGNVLWAFVLLVAISIYDMIAVWKSKHMVKMAKFQSESKLFAGLMIPYKRDKDEKPVKTVKSAKKTKLVKETSVNAILGGGDVAFPLIFSGTLMEGLMRNGIGKMTAYLQVNIVTVTTALALFLLLYFAKKNRFYPAMPFVSAGCLVGYLIILLL